MRAWFKMEESKPSSVHSSVREAGGEHVSAVTTDWMQGNAASATAVKTDIIPARLPPAPGLCSEVKSGSTGWRSLCVFPVIHTEIIVANAAVLAMN